MEFEFGNFGIFLPPLHITMALIVMIFFLVRWSKQLETGGYKVFFYFLISTYAAPMASWNTEEGLFELWIPIGFIAVFSYLLLGKSYHPSKMKASILGFCLAIYQIISHYAG
ncbi:hypothetical protein CR194_04385 [Salipaludibacillus keqinensis]|uniref:Uncharacterized protein n=1 Tax=Salipaludibacillus keqinensis TaxID=2045207 RepID=A0A323TI15_9BACI|nr:hypothetical protein [Salipaludibacillus keqinensis]PYZ94772.1 hypothetical protein CR194_04385 [Salipaludibacillus keqinensis]